jgi:UDP-glucuronate decarboxylase
MIRMMNNEVGLIGPVNIGNPIEFSVVELAQAVLRLTDRRGRLIYKDLPGDDPKQRQPDMALAREKLGWQPVVQLEAGLRKTIDYF